jgi:D-alanine-D-alanine ligase
MLPEKALHGVDVAFNALHGEFGEDGGVQRYLEVLKIPYTGSNTVASALAFNKQRTKEAVVKLGVMVPRGVVVNKGPDIEQTAIRVFRTFPHPAIVKPIIGGSSVGTTLAENFHTLRLGLERAFEIAPRALIEEYIKGQEAAVGVIDDFRGEKTYALLPLQIIPPPQSPFYDYDAKYHADTQLVCPGNFSPKIKQELQRISQLVHQQLGLSHYSRSDFVVGKRGIYFLEINTLPGLTAHSHVPRALQAIGSKLSEFLDHVITLARKQ